MFYSSNTVRGETFMKFCGIALALLLITAPAYAADVDGKWSGSVSGPAGDFQVAFTFKAEGATLTGSTVGFDGAEIPIKDGKVDGKDISFNVTFDFGGMPFQIFYKGVVSATEIKITADAAGMPIEMTLKKDK
jgi:hypothetical protein